MTVCRITNNCNTTRFTEPSLKRISPDKLVVHQRLWRCVLDNFQELGLKISFLKIFKDLSLVTWKGPGLADVVVILFMNSGIVSARESFA